mgnify:CR=1 FL=1
MAKLGRKPIPESTKTAIEDIFLRGMAASGGNHPKSVDVYCAQDKQMGNAALAESTVRALVARLRTKYLQRNDPFVLEPWKPSWRDLQGKPLDQVMAASESNEFLFRMNRLKLDSQKSLPSRTLPIRLNSHEASWAVRTYRPLSSAHEMVRTLVTLWYAEREIVAHYKGGAPEVEDLDAVLMYKPWLGGRHFRDYEESVKYGGEPTPKIYYGEAFKPRGKSIIFSLGGIDALLFAFWSVIKHPSLIRGALWSITNKDGASSRTNQRLTAYGVQPRGSWLEDSASLARILAPENTNQVPPFLRVIMNPVADLFYQKLRPEDSNYLLSSLSDIHDLAAENLYEKLPT